MPPIKGIPNPRIYPNNMPGNPTFYYPTNLDVNFMQNNLSFPQRPFFPYQLPINCFPQYRPLAMQTGESIYQLQQSAVSAKTAGKMKLDDSLDKIEETSSGKELIKGLSYESRNVYKSLIRHIFSYSRKNRESIVNILQKNGYTMPDIEHAFYKINCYNDSERDRTFKKKAQATIRKMMAIKSIYTFILRETLNGLLINWETGKLGKISQKNSKVYKDVCRNFYEETVKVIGEPAQGKTFKL